MRIKVRLRSVNRYLFTNLDELETRWRLEENGQTLQEGVLPVALAAQQKKAVC